MVADNGTDIAHDPLGGIPPGRSPAPFKVRRRTVRIHVITDGEHSIVDLRYAIFAQDAIDDGGGAFVVPRATDGNVTGAEEH
jgi:hypothetical protein